MKIQETGSIISASWVAWQDTERGQRLHYQAHTTSQALPRAFLYINSLRAEAFRKPLLLVTPLLISYITWDKLLKTLSSISSSVKQGSDLNNAYRRLSPYLEYSKPS